MRFVIRAWQRIQLAIFCIIVVYSSQACSINQETQKYQREGGETWSLLVYNENEPHPLSISSVIPQRLSKPTDGEYMCLKTVVCFVTHCCVYVANLLPGTKPECGMNGFTVQPKLWQVAARTCARLKQICQRISAPRSRLSA